MAEADVAQIGKVDELWDGLANLPSRAAAVRELLRYGLASVGAAIENMGVKSGEYGVLKAPKGLRSVESAQGRQNGSQLEE
jgi:hypothetical protein